MTTYYDINEYIDILEQSGITRVQAVAMSKAQHVVIAGIIGSGVATKTDISELKSEIKADISELKSELKADIALLRSDMKTDKAELKADIALLRSDMNSMSSKIMISLGAVMAIGFTVLGFLIKSH